MKSISKVTISHIALIIVNVIYSFNYSIAKEILDAKYIAPFGFIILRVIGACLLFWLIMPFTKKEKVAFKDIKKLALLAVFGIAGNQLCFFYGLHHTTTINASIIMTSNPVIVMLMGVFILKEKLTWNRITGIVCALAGAIILIAFKGSLDTSGSTAIGDLFILINSLSWGLYVVLVKPLMLKYDAMTILRITFLFGIVYTLPFGGEQALSIDWAAIPTHLYFNIGFVIIGATFFAYLLNVYSVRYLSPSVVSSYIYMQPLLTTLIALSKGKETFVWQQGLAACLIFIGVYLVSQINTLKPKKV